MAEPMVRQLRRAQPEARIITVNINAPIAEVMKRIGGVETVVTGSGIKKLLKSTKTTRGFKPDYYIVPFPSNRWQYNFLAKASGAKRVIIHGYPMPAYRAAAFLHRSRVPAQRGLHDVVQNLRLLDAIDLTPDYSDTPKFVLNETDRAAANQLIEEASVMGKFVVIHAGSAQTILARAKRWPTQKYAELVQTIRDRCRFSIVVVEGPDEAGVSDSIISKVSDRSRIHTIKLRGNLGIGAAVIERSEFYCGTDSGLAHLAAAVGRRAITLFAPADPDRVCPYGNRDLVIQPPGVEQVPFLYPWYATKPKLRMDDVDIIRKITVEQVMEKVEILVR